MRQDSVVTKREISLFSLGIEEETDIWTGPVEKKVCTSVPVVVLVFFSPCMSNSHESWFDLFLVPCLGPDECQWSSAALLSLLHQATTVFTDLPFASVRQLLHGRLVICN